VEVEAMSQAQSPSIGHAYGRVRILAAWRVPRSTFYARQHRTLNPTPPPQRRGPKTAHSDTELVELIRQSIADSPLHGEGHRKFWVRLRVQGVRTPEQLKRTT
jgi:hypothetical protein